MKELISIISLRFMYFRVYPDKSVEAVGGIMMAEEKVKGTWGGARPNSGGNGQKN